MTNIKPETNIKYEVTYGPKEDKSREKKSFSNEEDALKFFEKKDKENFHVDAYEVETVVKKRKLSK